MATESPFEIAVYDKAFARKGWIGDPIEVRASPRHNLLPTAEVTWRADHPRTANMLTPGARCVIRYDGEHLIGGRVADISGQGPSSAATFTATIEDDWRLVTRMLGWPVPAAALNAQDPPYQIIVNQPAETIAKTVIGGNATRLGLPVTIAPDLGRGPDKGTAHRFHPLTDRLVPMLDFSGLGLTVRQQGAGLVVDVYQTATYPRTLTEASGVVQSWAWTRTAPSVTRVVAGNQGEQAARVFSSLVDSPLEALWGDKIERFLDARDTDDITETNQRMAELLDEGAATSGLSVELSETATFRYGAGVRVGDRITIDVGHTQVTDVLREATISWTAGDGLVVTPTVGEIDTSQRRTAKAIAALAKTVRNLGRV